MCTFWITIVVFSLVQDSSPEELLASLVACDAVVYGITEAPQQVDEASWAVQGET